MEIIQLVSFELINSNLKEEWKKMSDQISAGLQGEDGFIYRDSAIDENGKVYCILKWESKEKAEASRKRMQKKYQDAMESFAKIANMDTMSSELLQVV